MSEKDGGRAFPCFETLETYDDDAGKYREVVQPVGGMSLRDYFAGQALAGWLSNDAIARIVERQQMSPSGAYIVLTSTCYQLADAMLAERAKS